jgi:uncharacterized CHY-type Zn-finger protein
MSFLVCVVKSGFLFMKKISKCLYCKRIVANKDFLTKNGCIYCDSVYNRKMKENEEKEKCGINLEHK